MITGFPTHRTSCHGAASRLSWARRGKEVSFEAGRSSGGEPSLGVRGGRLREGGGPVSHGHAYRSAHSFAFAHANAGNARAIADASRHCGSQRMQDKPQPRQSRRPQHHRAVAGAWAGGEEPAAHHRPGARLRGPVQRHPLRRARRRDRRDDGNVGRGAGAFPLPGGADLRRGAGAARLPLGLRPQREGRQPHRRGAGADSPGAAVSADPLRDEHPAPTSTPSE